jgi:hypothetical protein
MIFCALCLVQQTHGEPNNKAKPIVSLDEIIELLPEKLVQAPEVNWDKFQLVEAKEILAAKLVGRQITFLCKLEKITVEHKGGKTWEIAAMVSPLRQRNLSQNGVRYVILTEGRSHQRFHSGTDEARKWDAYEPGQLMWARFRIERAWATSTTSERVLHVSLDLLKDSLRLATATSIPSSRPSVPVRAPQSRPATTQAAVVFRSMQDILAELPADLRNLRAWDDFAVLKVQKWLDDNVAGRQVDFSVTVTGIEVNHKPTRVVPRRDVTPDEVRLDVPPYEASEVLLRVHVPLEGRFLHSGMNNRCKLVVPKDCSLSHPEVRDNGVHRAYRFRCSKDEAQVWREKGSRRSPGGPRVKYTLPILAIIKSVKIVDFSDVLDPSGDPRGLRGYGFAVLIDPTDFKVLEQP